MIMKLMKDVFCAAILVLLYTVNGHVGSGKYGFSTGGGAGDYCDMWNLPFPVTIQIPVFMDVTGGTSALVHYNIIWVSDHGNGMGYYYDFYEDYGNNGHSFWPKEYDWDIDKYFDINIGNSVKYKSDGTKSGISCYTDTMCTEGEHVAVNAGMSKYNQLVQEFGEGNVKVANRVLDRADGQYNEMLDGRSFKLLRIEIFTSAGDLVTKGHYEPFYLEYRPKSGSKNELELVEYGGYTFSTSDKNNITELNRVVNLNRVSALQLKIDWVKNDMESTMHPTEHIFMTAKTTPVSDKTLTDHPMPKTCE